MGLEVQVADHLGLQHVKNMGTGGNPETGREFPRDRGAAWLIRALQDQHLPPGLGQIGGANQAIVSGADNQDIMKISHRRSPPE